MDQRATLAIMNAIARGDSENVYRVAIVTTRSSYEGDLSTTDEYYARILNFAFPDNDFPGLRTLLAEIESSAQRQYLAYKDPSSSARRMLLRLVSTEFISDAPLGELQPHTLAGWKSRPIYLTDVVAGGLPSKDSEYSAIVIDLDDVVAWYPVEVFGTTE